jgi:hypothetical protein
MSIGDLGEGDTDVHPGEHPTAVVLKALNVVMVAAPTRGAAGRQTTLAVFQY